MRTLVSLSYPARLACLAVLLAALGGGCGPVLNGPDGVNRFLTPSAESQIDVAIAAMTRGEYGLAEQSIKRAFAADAMVLMGEPQDPLLFLVAGTLYQNTNRPHQAVQNYREVLRRDPKGYVSGLLWGHVEYKPIVDIARENLEILDPSPIVASSEGSGKVSREALQDIVAEAREDAHITQRFILLAHLLEQGLITESEWLARRQRNIGIFTPLTAQVAPSAALGTEPPSERDVMQRLQALHKALGRRAMTVGRHEMERKIILDGILPLDPPVTVTPPEPPDTPERVRAALDRLNMWNGKEFLKEDEYEWEKQAIENMGKPEEPQIEGAAQGERVEGEGTADAPPPPPTVANPAATLQSGRAPLQIVPTPDNLLQSDEASAPGSGGIVAAYIASYGNKAMAEAAWTDFQKQNPDLEGLSPQITSVTRPDGSKFFRLNVGPFEEKGQAQELCEKIKIGSCEAVLLGG